MKLFTPKQTKEADRSVLDELLRKENAAAVALKAKETQLNQLELEYPVRIAAKQRELVEIERRLQLAREKEQSEVFVLEERRKEALKPITEEQQALQKTKDQIQDMLLRLDTERDQIRKERELLRVRSEEVEKSLLNLEKTQHDMLSMLEQRRVSADASVDAANIALNNLHAEEERVAALRMEAEERHAGLKEAEHIAKGAMANADKQIKRAEEERRKVTEERKLLGAAIKEAKKRGVWLTR